MRAVTDGRSASCYSVRPPRRTSITLPVAEFASNE